MIREPWCLSGLSASLVLERSASVVQRATWPASVHLRVPQLHLVGLTSKARLLIRQFSSFSSLTFCCTSHLFVPISYLPPPFRLSPSLSQNHRVLQLAIPVGGLLGNRTTRERGERRRRRIINVLELRDAGFIYPAEHPNSSSICQTIYEANKQTWRQSNNSLRIPNPTILIDAMDNYRNSFR